MKVANMLMLAGVSVLMLAACGSGTKTNTDSTLNSPDTAGLIQQDTIPSAQMPPGAINPGEDSSRFGTGTNDSSKNRPQP